MLAVALLHLADHGRDGGRVELGSLHQRRGPRDVVGIDGVEEILDLPAGRQLLQNERSPLAGEPASKVVDRTASTMSPGHLLRREHVEPGCQRVSTA